jgi:ArsR family metal-binding transcriptional regulator
MYIEIITLTKILPCLAFAFSLWSQERKLDECLPSMINSAFAERRATL